MARPKKEDKTKTSSVKESKAVTSQKKVVKKETKKNTKLNTFENVEKKRKNVSVTEPKTEPIVNIETEIKNKVDNEQVLTSIEPEVEVTNEGILPETSVLDEQQTNQTKEELSSIEPIVNKKEYAPFDLGKIFLLKLGAEFLDGHLKIQTQDTKIQRRSEENYHVFGQIEQGAPFDVTFECVDREEADFLWGQLLDYEKNPDKYIKEVPKTEQLPVTTTEQPAVTKETSVVNEAITNQVDTKPIEPEKKIEDFSGIPLSTVDLDKIINSMPETKKEQVQPQITQNPVQHLATSTNISHIINNQNVAQMEAYGESIASHINGSFQANIWGAMPLDAAKMFISSCSTEYTYNFKNDGKGYFMELTKDKTTVRIPKKLDEYLKIS